MSQKNYAQVFVFLMVLFFIPTATRAEVSETFISVFPKSVVPGEPVIIKVTGINNLSAIASGMFGTKQLDFFLHKSEIVALVAVGLSEKSGARTVKVLFTDGRELELFVEIKARPKVEVPLGIPDKLGGNTPKAQNNLVSSIYKENAEIASVYRKLPKVLWVEPFRLPLSSLTITDSFGYSRKTGSFLISHNGVDLRAKSGTPIFSANRGIVRLAREFSVYGKTVVIDHGLGVQTLYLHLSNILVNPGELVLSGQKIGRTGQSGYAEYPHLHFGVRLGGVAVDPIKFMELWR